MNEDKIHARVPEFAETIVNELKKPKNKEKVKFIARSKLRNLVRSHMIAQMKSAVVKVFWQTIMPPMYQLLIAIVLYCWMDYKPRILLYLCYSGDYDFVFNHGVGIKKSKVPSLNIFCDLGFINVRGSFCGS